jgi:hypothetical protein
LIDSLNSHQGTLEKAADHICHLQAQLRGNQISAENEIKLKKEQLLLEIERLYSLAMKDIEIQVKVKGDLINERLSAVAKQQEKVVQAVDMIKLKIKTAGKQKFVKNYLSMSKEAEELLSRQVSSID